MIAVMFEDLDSFLRDLARRKVTLTPGETVFLQGDLVRHIYFVISGAIELIRHQASGAPLVIQRAGPGAILAEASLDSARYHCAAVAVAKSALWAVSKKDLLRRMAENPNLALAFVRRLAHELQNALSSRGAVDEDSRSPARRMVRLAGLASAQGRMDWPCGRTRR